ncbi:Fc receptor-like B [Heterocephalus glaber]|uniref:Fc receptor-like B n=1 Tax=Heterocephalus glaber TaxID=10181 RepID=G5BWG5_HETGA|nr:Fc receptor-like B [Heterocephalus glaber]
MDYGANMDKSKNRTHRTSLQNDTDMASGNLDHKDMNLLRSTSASSTAATDRLVMWALTALLLLVLSTGQAATLEKPILSLHPPWTTIFKGERVTLRCDGHYPLFLELRPISTLWYLGHLLLPSHKKSIEVQTPGVYRCQTRGAPVSDPIHLSVSNDWLILQVPYTAVFEGEPLIMRCRGWYDKVVYKLHYYHDGQAVRYFHSSTNYTVLQARASDSGRYQCSGTMRIPVESAPMFSAKVAVTVQAWLILQVPYTAVFEGEPLIMRCRGWYDKVVYKLHYYHDGQAVRYFHSSTNYTVLQARASDSGRYQCSGTMRIPVESAPMFSAKVAVTVQELFQTPVLKVLRSPEARGAAPRGVTLRCETRLHPQKRDSPLQFAFYKYSRAVRRFDWAAEYTVPEPEVEELEAYWCEAATSTRSVQKRSPWLQLPGPDPAPRRKDLGCLFTGSPLDLASTSAPEPQAAALAPDNKLLSIRKPPVSRLILSVTSVPNATSAGLQFPAGGSAPTAGPPACAQPTPVGQWAGALKPNVDLFREVQLLISLLSRVVVELKEPQALLELRGSPETPTSHFAVSPGTPETTPVGT